MPELRWVPVEEQAPCSFALVLMRVYDFRRYERCVGYLGVYQEGKEFKPTWYKLKDRGALRVVRGDEHVTHWAPILWPPEPEATDADV